MEYRILLTPAEAAAGTTRTIELPSGPMTVRVPPTQRDRAFRVPTAQGDIVIRVETETDPDAADDEDEDDAEPIQGVRSAPARKPRRNSRNHVLVGVSAILISVSWLLRTAVDNEHKSTYPPGVQVVMPTPDDGDPGYEYTLPDNTYTDTAPTDSAYPKIPQLLDPANGTPTASPGGVIALPATLGGVLVNPPKGTPYPTGSCFRGSSSDAEPSFTVEPTACVADGKVYEVVKVLMNTADSDPCADTSGKQAYSIYDQGKYSNGTKWQAVYCAQVYS
ncbi:MAG TPA: hypothetical protein VGX23_14955 [Actinocrinis sp.]|nr:hypothetical protein [Actinocrinis sp.]